MRSAITRIEDFKLIKDQRVIERDGIIIRHIDPLAIHMELPKTPDADENIELMKDKGISFDTFEEANQAWSRIQSARNPVAYFRGIWKDKYN